MEVAKKFLNVSVLAFLLFAIVGCNGENNGEKAYNFLEKAAKAESVFNAQQEPIVAEEKKEQELYEKIMDLGMDKYDKIKTYSDQALASVEKRKEMIDKEKESIDEAYETFKKAIPYMEKVEDKEAKEYAEEIINTMEKRYNAYQDLYATYTKSIEKDTKLFTMLKNKELTIEELQKQLKEVNASYKKIDAQKDEFNKYTKTFNEAKQSFYKELGLIGEEK